jgi:hypothetical protein
MSLEVHVTTRSKLLPDPEYDQLSAIFFVIANDEGCGAVCRKSGQPSQNGSCLQEGHFFLPTMLSALKGIERPTVFTKKFARNKVFLSK